MSEEHPKYTKPMAATNRPINPDQVAWMLAAIRRYLPPVNAPHVSRATDLQAYALLYELMEVANLRFQDDAAARNGTPSDVQRLALKGAETERHDALLRRVLQEQQRSVLGGPRIVGGGDAATAGGLQGVDSEGGLA